MSIFLKCCPTSEVYQYQYRVDRRRLILSFISVTQKVLLPVVGLTFSFTMLFLGLTNHYSYQSLCA